MKNKKIIIGFFIACLVIIFSIGLFNSPDIVALRQEGIERRAARKKEKEEASESDRLEKIAYPEDAYTSGVLDPQKLAPKAAINQDSDLVLINKQYVVDEKYAPDVEKVDGYFLQPHVIDAFREMQEAAAKDDVNLVIGSAYRSYAEQYSLFNTYLDSDPYETVITYSAYPGTSEHQTGLVIDFAEGDTCDYTECFDTTDSGKWLKDNAYKYGFILRYPKDKDDITGYMYEPWHYRYVGKKDAKKIYEQDVTLEEYLLLEENDA